MFYISSIKGKKWGVTDTEDGVEEFYSERELKKITDNGVLIQGVSRREEGLNVRLFMPNFKRVLSSKVGTPVLVTFNASKITMQCLVVEVSSMGVTLFDGTVFLISWKYLYESLALITFDKNDPVRVSRLVEELSRIKKL